jgi:hypothetical protein
VQQPVGIKLAEHFIPWWIMHKGKSRRYLYGKGNLIHQLFEQVLCTKTILIPFCGKTKCIQYNSCLQEVPLP